MHSIWHCYTGGDKQMYHHGLRTVCKVNGVFYVYNPRAGEAEAGRFLGLAGHPASTTRLAPSQKPVDSTYLTNIWGCSLTSDLQIHACICGHIYILCKKKKKLGDSVPKHLSGRIGSFQQRQQESELLGNVGFLRRAEQMLQSSHTCLLFRSRSWKGLTPAICMSQNQCYVRVEPKLVYVLRAQFSLKTLKVKFNPQRAVYSNPCLSQIQFLLEKKKANISEKK